MARALFAMAVFSAAVLVATVQGCGKWVASTPFEPIPDNAFVAKWAPYPSSSADLYFCSCRNQTGSLWNDDAGFGPGWKCWLTGSTYCSVGDFYVITSSFPDYNSPSIVNSTTTRPVPKGSLPGHNVADQFSCVQYASVSGNRYVVPGSLSIDHNTGNYICKSVTPNGYYKQRQTVNAGPGKFAAVVADKC